MSFSVAMSAVILFGACVFIIGLYLTRRQN